MEATDYRTQVFTITADSAILDNHALLSRCVDQLIAVGKFTRLDQTSHRFEPQGITMIALLSESHIALHTWPEQKAAKLVLATCQKDPVPTEDLIAVMKNQLSAEHVVCQEIVS